MINCEFNNNNFDFDKLRKESIIEYIHFFEKTNISNIPQISNIINTFKNILSSEINNEIYTNFFPISKIHFDVKNKNELGMRTEIYYYCINLYLLFITDYNGDKYYSNILLFELSKIYLILLNKIINQINLLDENSEDCRIGLLNDFDLIRNMLYKTDFENKNIFNELFYAIDKFIFDTNDFLSNRIINELNTIENNSIKYDSIICTLKDYFGDYKKWIYNDKNFKDFIEKLNIKIHSCGILQNISNCNKDKLENFFHNIYEGKIIY